MKRLISALGWLTALFVLCAVNVPQAWGQANITNPAVLANTVDGLQIGTENTQFIFRANIRPSNPALYSILWARVYIDVLDPANPEFGARIAIDMVYVGGPTGDLYVAYIPGYLMGISYPGPPHTWSIVSREGPGSTGGTLKDGTGAAPKPAGTLHVVPASSPNSVEVLPVDASFNLDKRANPGQLGGGLRVDPVDSTSPEDGGSAHFYTWRVRVRTTGGVPIQMTMQRPTQEWRDVRGIFETNPYFIHRLNSGMILVLIDPSGQKHYCPMELDPDAPGQAGTTFASTYTTDPLNPNYLLWPTGGAAAWAVPGGTGRFYRYRMLPAQYQFNWGGLPGEGPYTAFGGPTQPDLLPALPLGFQIGNEVIGRPFTNQYVAFAGPDRATPLGNFSPPPPFYTNTAGHAGQWRYYYQCSTDLRPPRRPGFPTNGDITTYPNDLYGSDIDAYNYVYDSDNGLGISSPATPYQHPLVTPILSDGIWTDDIAENGYANGTGGPTHRSRPTTKTRVRFEVRVTKGDNSPLPAQAVRVFIDGVPFSMQQVARPGNSDFIQGIVFYYDTQFSQGKEGQHFVYYEVDDGVHRSIWPRRDTPTQGTGDARFFDVQAALAPYGATYSNPVDFGTGTVGKNYLDEPLVNHRPVLTAGQVSPTSGSYGTQFIYTVLYTDADNDAPLNADVVIDGQAHRMFRVEDPSVPYSSGVHYTFTLTKLNPTVDDKHSYYFRFRDNWNNLGAYQVSNLRTEFGEWQTLPPGDDNGNPAFQISGPTIVGNHVSELTDASYFASDQSHTPATLYDFIVKYKDADNNPPSTLKVYLSKDLGATWDNGTDMVAAESSTNYVAGVLFHLSNRMKLPVINGITPYYFRFQSSDGVQTTNTTWVHVGTRDTAITDGTAHELKLLGGSTTVYGDPNLTNNLNSTKVWLNDPSTIYIWKFDGANYTRLVYGTDFAVDAANGQINLAQPTANRILASYFYERTVGPVITANHVPVLSVTDPGNAATNQGTLTPLQGTPATSFKYSILYTDADNQAPAYVRVIIDTNISVDMLMDPATPNPPNYANGVKYNATYVFGAAGIGSHNYHFEASDGVDVGRYPLASATPPDLPGPVVTDSTNLTNTLIQHSLGQINDPPVGPQTPKGTSVSTYTFTVTYKNPNGNAPQSTIEVRLTNQLNGNLIKTGLTPIDPIGPAEFKNGVRYQVQLSSTTVPPLTPGTYNVVFGFSNDQTTGTNPLVLTVNGRPVLSNPGASPNPASQAGDVVLGVNYADINGDSPSQIKLFLDGVEYTAVAPVTVPANPTPAQIRQGILYQWTIQAKNLSVGDHKYYFTAKDDLEDANPNPVPAPPGNTFTVVAAQVPVLLEPGGDATNNNGTLTPLKGSKTQTFTYSVIYKHGDGVPPTTLNLTIDRSFAGQRVIAMTPANGTPTQADFKAGVLYRVQLNDLASGAHIYDFTATDRLAPAAGHSVMLPVSGTYSGPTVNFVPVLSLGTVTALGGSSPTVDANNNLVPPQRGNTLTKWIFAVLYQDQDGAPPAGGFVRVTINGSLVIDLAPSGTGPFDYKNGVVYSTPAAGMTLSPGQKVFHFDAFDGLDAARFPAVSNSDISGLTVANIPVLSPINLTGDDGTLSPRSGPLSTVFTYRILYKNADNTPPVYVKVFIDGTSYDMTKTIPTASNYAAGVEYRFQYRFPANANHKYHFEAVDAVSTTYVARWPDISIGDIVGPMVNVAVFTTPSFAPLVRNNPPEPPVARLGVPLTITGKLVANAPIGDFIALKLIRPDGTGDNEQAATDPATGIFSFTFTPNQTGDWKVQFSWGGSAGTYDPVTTEFPFKVVMDPLTVVGGGLDMISIPLIPITPSPALTLAPTNISGGSVPVTAINLIKWVLNGSGGGHYSSLNNDGDFPGMTGGQGYWIRPDFTININPEGKLWDKNLPYEIPLQTGWNMIGSVYLDDINWSAAKVRSNGNTVSISDSTSAVRPVAWTYNPNSGAYAAVSPPDGVLHTFRGYWVRATAPCTLILNVPGARSAQIGRDVLQRQSSIQVAVRSGNRIEQDNFAPVTGMDKSRLALIEKPPYVENYVSVQFVPSEGVQLPAGTRAAAANKTVVTFDVVTDRKNSDVTVFFPNAAHVGRHLEGTVVDLANGTSHAIATSAGVTYNTGDSTKPHRFALLINNVVGPERLVISDLHGTSRAPGTYSFDYNVSVPATVRATVTSMTGSVVRDLDRGRSVSRGANSLVWDGKDSRGVSVPAGMYKLQLSGTDDKGNAAKVFLPVTIVR